MLIMSSKPKPKKITFSKFLVVFVMFWVVEVIVYSEVAMWKKNDLSSLYVLLGSVVTAGISAIITMMLKSKAENTKGGITYDMVMRDCAAQDTGESTDDEAVG